MWELVVKMHEDFPGHSAEYYYRAIMQQSRLWSKPCKISQWNAFEHRKRISANLIKDLAARWKDMSPEEKSEAVGDGVEKLSERQETWQHGVHNVAINAFHDVCATLNSISQQLDYLNRRTGADILLVVVRCDPEQYNRPYVFYTNDHIPQFVASATGKKETLHKFAILSPTVADSPGSEVAHSHHSDILQLKAQVRDLIEMKLKQACTRGKIERMFYVNFDEHVTLKYSIVVEEWPFPDKFIAPGKFGSVAELRVLLAAWESAPELTPSPSPPGLGATAPPPLPPLSSVPPPPIAPTPSKPAAASSSSAPAAAPGRKRPHTNTLSIQFLNAVTAEDGSSIKIPKRAQKERSDKNTKKGPRKKRHAGQDDGMSSSTSAPVAPGDSSAGGVDAMWDTQPTV
ncbi:hypothetical protein BN946_scf184662.g7 [Trametes cinnabarina]|uniref:Uncharacterized protein n=1 Tax=Pycnoporus cinnabarinus TaxID=5643 RepID=A0A060S4W0_PYCCI|nr:hypothetical protein BN946_scf184662.g7 [Trametes cinnabarina]